MTSRYFPNREFVDTTDRELLCESCADDARRADKKLVFDCPGTVLHGLVEIALCGDCHYKWMLDVNGSWIHIDGTTKENGDMTPETISDLMWNNSEELEAVKYDTSNSAMPEQY